MIVDKCKLAPSNVELRLPYNFFTGCLLRDSYASKNILLVVIVGHGVNKWVYGKLIFALTAVYDEV